MSQDPQIVRSGPTAADNRRAVMDSEKGVLENGYKDYRSENGSENITVSIAIFCFYM